MQSVDLLNTNPNPPEQEIRVGLEGSLCRCTATTTSSRQCSTRPDRGHVMTARRSAPPTRSSARSAATAAAKEDQRLITGRTRWTDNITLPGMLHLAMVRSPFAHATITSIDTSAAKQATNVVAVLTGADWRRGSRRSHQRLADHARPGHAQPLADAQRPGRLRR